jgi:hypothetical protein
MTFFGPIEAGFWPAGVSELQFGLTCTKLDDKGRITDFLRPI